MVERVARAISDAPGIPYVGRWDHYVPAARAVIEAMREPPAGDWPPYRYCASRDEHGQPIISPDDWEAMIETMLAEEPSEPATAT